MSQSEKKKILFVINPVAGTGAQKGIEVLIDKYLDKSIFLCELFYTERARQAIELSKWGLLEDLYMVVAVGGDGTVNEVASNLINSPIILGIIPTGSGNGFARHMGIPLKIKMAIELLNSGVPKAVDIGQIQDRFFLNVAGVGFDALISHQFALVHVRGFASYAKLAMKSFMSYNSKTYQINVDGNILKKKAFIIAIANSSQYGNNATIAPMAKVDDGKLDLCIIRPFRWHNLLPLLIRLFNKTLHKSPLLEYHKAKQLEIHQESEYFHYDGEPAINGTSLKASVLPASLKVLTAKTDIHGK